MKSKLPEFDYYVRVKFPCNDYTAREVTWYNVKATSEDSAIKKARKLGSEKLMVEVISKSELRKV